MIRSRLVSAVGVVTAAALVLSALTGVSANASTPVTTYPMTLVKELNAAARVSSDSTSLLAASMAWSAKYPEAAIDSETFYGQTYFNIRVGGSNYCVAADPIVALNANPVKRTPVYKAYAGNCTIYIVNIAKPKMNKAVKSMVFLFVNLNVSLRLASIRSKLTVADVHAATFASGLDVAKTATGVYVTYPSYNTVGVSVDAVKGKLRIK